MSPHALFKQSKMDDFLLGVSAKGLWDYKIYARTSLHTCICAPRFFALQEVLEPPAMPVCQPLPGPNGDNSGICAKFQDFSSMLRPPCLGPKYTENKK